jgi:hypothetical protein
METTRRYRWWRGWREEEEGAIEPPRMCGRCEGGGLLDGSSLPTAGVDEAASWLLL